MHSEFTNTQNDMNEYFIISNGIWYVLDKYLYMACCNISLVYIDCEMCICWAHRIQMLIYFYHAKWLSFIFPSKNQSKISENEWNEWMRLNQRIIKKKNFFRYTKWSVIKAWPAFIQWALIDCPQNWNMYENHAFSFPSS